MRAFQTVLVALTAWLLAVPALAQAVPRVSSNTVDAASVTIYPDNLALVTEVRTVNVPAGRSVIAFEGVSDLIIPQSMILREFTGLSLERNFDYDLMGKAALFEKSLGESITLTRIDKASGKVTDTQATIISARRDTGVVIDVNGKTEVLMCSGLSERTQFDGLPAGLNPMPVMSIEVSAERAGPQEVVISYLTSGLGWRADYRLDLNHDASKASMLGWLTLTNGTAKDYKDVALSIIAGDLNRRPETRAVSPPKPFLRAQCYPRGSTKRGISTRVRQAVSYGRMERSAGLSPMMAMAAPEMEAMADSVIVTGARKMATQENVGDYKLYRVPGATSVMPYQTKQIAFVDNPDVGIEPYYKAEFYSLENAASPRPTQLMYDIDNSRDGTLGVALPKGTMRLFAKTKSGRTVFLGEDRVDNLAVNEPVRLSLGQSRNVSVQASGGTVTRKNGSLQTAYHSVRVFNALDRQARVKIIYKDERLRGGVITAESIARDPDEIEPTYWLDVAPESRTSVSFGIGVDLRYRIDLDPLSRLLEGERLQSDDFYVESDGVLAGSETPLERVEIFAQPVTDGTISVVSFATNIRRTDGSVTADITHALKNTSGTPKVLTLMPRYAQLSPRSISVTNATTAPLDRDRPEWRLGLAGDEEMVLRYTVTLVD